MLPTCCLYLQLRPPSRKKSSLKLTLSVTFHDEFRITETDRVEADETDETDVICFRAASRVSTPSNFCGFRRGTEAWIHGMAPAAQQDRARPGDQDISTSRHPEKIRYEIDMKNHDRFYERFYERH